MYDGDSEIFYTVYKTTNLVNGKVYVGKHQTKDLDDDYLGSGKYLNRAIKKHGRENFKKEILYVFGTEEEMNDKEAELVTEEFCLREDTYNICPGGKGGWGYVNANTPAKEYGSRGRLKFEAINETIKRRRQDPDYDAKYREELERRASNGRQLQRKLYPQGTFFGKKHSEETKLRIGSRNKEFTGSKNSQFGTVWITNGLQNKKIKSLDTIPEGWYKGRKIAPVTQPPSKRPSTE